jgi:hypothetical protein
MAYDVIRNLLLQGDRFALIEKTSDGFEFLMSNSLGKDVETQIPTRILTTVLQNASTLMLPDALSDQRHGDSEIVKNKNIRSVLCIPFEIPGDRRALIYIDSLDQAAAFSVKDKREIEGLAQRLTRNLQVIAQANPESVDLSPNQPTAGAFNTLRYALVSALVLLFVIVVGSVVSYSSPAKEPVEKPKVSEEAPPDLTDRPFGVTREFMSALMDESFEEAKQYLTESLSSAVTGTELESLSKELKTGIDANSPFQVLSEEVQGRKATVVVGQTLQGSPDNLWTLHFVQDRGKWKLAFAKGKLFPKRVWGKDANGR